MLVTVIAIVVILHSIQCSKLFTGPLTENILLQVLNQIALTLNLVFSS